MPDLIGCIAPRKVLLADIKDQKLESASAELINDELAFPRSVYSFRKISENLKVLPSYENINTIVEWSIE